MQNTRLIVIILLISGILLLLFIGAFLFSAMRSSQTDGGGLDTQRDIDRTRTIDSDSSVRKPTNGVENEESGPADYIEDALEDQKRNNPDIYIYNKVPFENQYFRIEGVGRAEGNPDFSFIVSLKGQDRPLAEGKLKEWMAELGLTPSQVASLLIEYR